MNRLRLVGLWLVVVVATSATTWLVIRSAGAGLTTQATSQPVTTTAVEGTTPARPTGPPPPRDRHRPPHHRSTAAPSPVPPSAPAPQTPTRAARVPRTETRTWQDAAGTVVTACSGSRIELRGAQANQGWRVEVRNRGPREISVRFEQGGDDGGEADVLATCAGGVPRYQASQTSGDD